MTHFIHFDEAVESALDVVRRWIAIKKTVEVMLVIDLYGKMRLVIFPGGDVASLVADLHGLCGDWWTGDALIAEELDKDALNIFVNARDADARMDDQEPRLKILERHRSRTAWFASPLSPIWEAPNGGAPIVVFYSFKGGLGRSTALASFAIQRAHAGERVCIIDMDLDSPGAGQLLAADRDGLSASWGVVDFLLEYRSPGLDFTDYWHRCDRVANGGEIRIMPSGRIDSRFADKLARIDLEQPPSAHESGLWRLLQLTREKFEPDWILLDARTGISEPAGQLLSGIGHLHVLLGTFQEQSWQGLDRVLDRLGKDRVLANQPQAEVVLVQAMVPVGEPGKLARESFAGRAEASFEERYYADRESDPDVYWTVNDKQGEDAPHVPVPIEYEARLASFEDIEDVAGALMSGAYLELGARILSRFLKEDAV